MMVCEQFCISNPAGLSILVHDCHHFVYTDFL